MANANDLLIQVGDPGTATTLSAPGYTAGGTSITVGSTSNWPTATGVIFAIDEAEVVDGEEVRIDGTYNEFEGVVSTGTSITSVDWVRGVGDRNYAAGALTRVYIPVSAERENRLVEGILVSLDQDGTLKAGAVDNAAALASNVVTTDKILNSNVTTAKIADANVTTAKIADSNVTTAKVADDAITDAKLVYGKVHRRQGGSATIWGASGSTTYDVSATDLKIQTGVATTDATVDVTITFPVAYTYQPVFVCSVSGNNAGTGAITANCFAEAVQVSAAGATLRTFNTSGGQSNQAVAWIAIGV